MRLMTRNEVLDLSDASLEGVKTFAIRDRNNEFEALHGIVQILPQILWLQVERNNESGILKVSVQN